MKKENKNKRLTDFPEIRVMVLAAVLPRSVPKVKPARSKKILSKIKGKWIPNNVHVR